MRHLLVTFAILSVLLFTACGGSRKTQEPEVDIQDFSQQDTSRDDVTVLPEEDLTKDSGVTFDDSQKFSEKPLSEMTLEEINAAEFLKNVYFEFDKFELTDLAITQLEQNGRWLLQNPSTKVIIEGHCDERGTEEYNLALGERRANSARDFLVRMGVSVDRLMTASYGESRPLDPRSSEDAWSRNRRAHFRVYSR